MTQDERNLLYDIAYQFDCLRRFSWRGLARALKQLEVRDRGSTVVMNGAALEKIAERIREITERDGSKLVSK